MDVLIAVFLLTVVATLCTAGVLLPYFKDNLFQCVGMGMIAIWCVSTISRLIARGWVFPESLILYAGLALFAAGTAIKVYKFSSKKGVRNDVRRSV